ncbi:hypothetical protein B0H16DRAFT_1574909 [Mycena metata]|uniref:Uncharacterized protein n=1 Tax=Mycena metata TaxID=1033252 RepID=A0AAD7I669_9AGAR|nr:hypothetical protein B0H16DRAFT_1574909 [Mycena metata]
MPSDLTPRSQYLLLRISPPVGELSLRQALQENLTQTFGLTASGTHLDVLWVDSDAKTALRDDATGQALIRVDYGDDATRLLASIVASSSPPRLSLIKASVFLPSLLVDDEPL